MVSLFYCGQIIGHEEERGILMSRRGDNIHKRKDGRWEGRYKCGVKDDGKTIYRSVYAYSYNECKNKLEKAKANTLISKSNYSDIKFSEILELWLSVNKIRTKGSTENKYRYMIDLHIKPELGSYKVSCLTSTVINNFLQQKLENGSKNNEALSPSYVRTLAIIIESSLKFAVNEEFCEPLKNKINKPNIPKKELYVLSVTEQNQYEYALKENKTLTALGTLIALHTGMRIGEICALQWNDIDLENNLIYVKHTVSRIKTYNQSTKTKLIIDTPKTNSSNRVIPISSVLKPFLEDALKNKKTGFVISETQEFTGTRTFDYRYRKLISDAGLKVVGFHTLRHTFATRCIEAGMDIKTLSEILGHASATTTLNIYVHSSLENKRIQIEKLYAAP